MTDEELKRLAKAVVDEWWAQLGVVLFLAVALPTAIVGLAWVLGKLLP